MTVASMTLAPLTWCSQRIGTSITAAAAAWMVSGMSASPLLNSLLPALGSATALLPIPSRARAGVALQLAGVLLLLTALLVWGPSWRNPRPLPQAEPEPAAPETLQQGSAGRRLDLYPLGSLQGLLFGALFALLPLWVRTISQGTCLDFGMLLTVFGIGRPLAPLFRLAATLRYLAMALLLLSTFWLSGWAAVLLFLLLGGLAAGSDAALADRLTDAAQGQDSDGAERLNSVEHSFALGGVVGSVVMGAACQALGLLSARWLMVAGFLIAAIALPMRPSPAADPGSPGQAP